MPHAMLVHRIDRPCNLFTTRSNQRRSERADVWNTLEENGGAIRQPVSPVRGGEGARHGQARFVQGSQHIEFVEASHLAKPGPDVTVVGYPRCQPTAPIPA